MIFTLKYVLVNVISSPEVEGPLAHLTKNLTKKLPSYAWFIYQGVNDNILEHTRMC